MYITIRCRFVTFCSAWAPFWVREEENGKRGREARIPFCATRYRLRFARRTTWKGSRRAVSCNYQLIIYVYAAFGLLALPFSQLQRRALRVSSILLHILTHCIPSLTVRKEPANHCHYLLLRILKLDIHYTCLYLQPFSRLTGS